MTHPKHLGEADADGDKRGEKHEEVGDLRGSVAPEEAAQFDLVLEGDRVEDDTLDDCLKLCFNQRLNVGDLFLQHLLLFLEVPFHKARTNE